MMKNKLNQRNMIIRKAICVSFALLFSLSPLAQSWGGSPVCQKEACMMGDLEHLQASADSKSTVVPFGCCSGSQAAPCDFGKGRNVDIPDDIMLTARLENHDNCSQLAVTGDDFPGKPAIRGFGPQFLSKIFPQSVPIYLYTLALLC